ncbi:Putative glycoside hydrolase family 31, galactose mutarotase-like domain superfamily [Septoria linicola]|uniref:alpha-glucosidase n=1 Tax=Septoria linicola TaxID=215465 RepID=A0A9Q9EE12_9PEZI|nr:putative glycoside hydrolase family 31, galactose mutarotase-like domain superfamily [Septoria linicola]USW47385.1 Putative glycoside hydrolase family 31, galactose mutarotase-like domain superfamily [Septoria linicola]
MPQQEFVPKAYTLLSSSKTSLHLQSTETSKTIDFTFEALRPGLFRTTFTSESHPLPPFPSARRPEARNDTFAAVSSEEKSRTYLSGEIKATVSWNEVPLISVGFADQELLHTDLPFRSYTIDGTGIAHYSRYHRGSLHVGLGEKAAPMDLSGRHFTLSATDSFGYDVHRTDPLYKHIPLLIRAGPEGVVATFSTSHARGYYSVGSEMDGMWGFFKVYRQDHGGLEQYTIVGKTLEHVVGIYSDLVGKPLLVPRWAFGYLGGGMKYSMLDEPRASEALTEWADTVEKHDIPCSGFQMSSGYTVAETEPKTRNVFKWNRHRFPDPKGFTDAFHKRGIRLIANIKPYVLESHPAYQKLVEAGALFKDMNTGGPGIARLWSAGGGESGEGGHIDFSSKAGYDFWYEGVKQLRLEGMDCMWNDNNEYVVPNDTWQMALDNEHVQGIKERRTDIGLWGRAMHTELHGKASHDALLDVVPHERPFVLSRSGTAGTFRYACSTWSGDNITSWDGMRGANALSLNAGMCLMQCYGHDIGGFEGPQPSPELLLRWVQLGCHSPRFAINCFKTGTDNLVGDVIEPWMYPEILPEVRKAIKRRYEMMPYIYGLMLKSHFTAVPPQRWVGWDYEHDPEVWTNKTLKDGEQQYWLGDTLLVGGVYEPDTTQAKIYTPKNSNSDPGFLNLNAPYQYLSSGQWHMIASPWRDSIPLLARIGGAIPIGKNKQVVAPGDKTNEANLPADDWRGVEIFPPPEDVADGTTMFTSDWYEDDGISPPPAKVATFKLSYAATAREVKVWFERDVAAFVPPWVENGITIVLPVGDGRVVVSGDHESMVEARRPDASGRKRFHLFDPREEMVERRANGLTNGETKHA